MIRTIGRTFSAAGLITVLVIQLACATNFATSLRAIAAAGAPVLTILVQQGKISQSLRDGLITDLTNEGYKIGDMATCFNGIPKGAADSKLQHLQCVQTLEGSQETKKLLADFGSNPSVENIAADFDAILQGAIIFYGGTPRRASARHGSSPLPTTEKALNEKVQQLKRDLGQ